MYYGHFDRAMNRIEKVQVSKHTIMLFKRYYTNSLLIKAESLNGQELEKYLEEIKSRKVYKNIKTENLKQLIKKVLLKINIKLYLKMR